MLIEKDGQPFAELLNCIDEVARIAGLVEQFLGRNSRVSKPLKTLSKAPDQLDYCLKRGLTRSDALWTSWNGVDCKGSDPF